MKPEETKGAKMFSEQVGEKERRKLIAKAGNHRSVWFGLGMFGMVGWSVAVPTLLGAMLGIWLDKKFPQSFSWTLTFLLLGLVCGGLVAAHWVFKENEEMHSPKNEE